MSQRKNATQTSSKRAHLRFMPRLIFALLLACGIYYAKSAPPAQEGRGRLIYEADSEGKMRRIAPSPVPIAPQRPALWKPEVSILAAHAASLHLTPSQRKTLESLAAEWERAKSESLRQIERAASGAEKQTAQSNQQGNLSQVALANGLGEYSRLSQEYNRQREAFWRRGVDTLATSQKNLIESLFTGKGVAKP